MKYLFHRIVLIFILLAGCVAMQAQTSFCATPIFPSEAPRYEVRAVWLTTLSGLDWPTKPQTGAEGAQRQKAELCSILDDLQRAGVNTVIFQARIRSTTAYPSAIEPWDGAFTGTPGVAPAYDPLAFAVEECHKRGMELHAWVVAFPICKVNVEKRLGNRSLPRLHPELCQRCGDQWMMDPGVPGTAAYIASICREIVERYDVDGIHLDYIRYPESGIPFNDTKTYRKYGAGRNKAEWRRDNVTRCVRAIGEAVRAVRPWVKLSCSPVGKYADTPRQSSYGWNARDAVHQDAAGWLQSGLMDMLFPMMYFDGKHFYPFVLDWQERSAGKPVVPGLGIYFLHKNEKNWPLSVVQRQLNFVRATGIGGEAFFRSKFLTDNVKGLYDYVASDFYVRPSRVPPMTWRDSIAPTAPQLTIEFEKNSLRLHWTDARDNDDTPVHYNLYRQAGVSADGTPCYVTVAERLTAREFRYAPALPALLHSAYAVTAVDAYGNESAPQWTMVAPTALAEAYPEVADTFRLPETPSDAEFLLLTDVQERHVMTCPMQTALSVSHLAPGFYVVRTLGRRGVSHRIAAFRKR